MENNHIKSNQSASALFKNKAMAPFEVLIVEDDPSFEPMWEYVLDHLSRTANYDWAFSVHEAERLIAINQALGKDYDLIITDIFLSGSNTGVDLWEKYNDKLNGNIIVVSSIEKDKMNQYFGARDLQPFYLKKPLDPDQCTLLINSFLNYGHN